MSGRAWCRCKVNSTQCIAVSGQGSPVCDQCMRADVVLDPATTNLIESGPDGLVFRVPTSVSRTIAFRINWQHAKTIDISEMGMSHLMTGPFYKVIVPFDEIIYDTSGIWQTQGTQAVIPRAGWWDLDVWMDYIGPESPTLAVDAGFIAFLLNGEIAFAGEGPQWAHDNGDFQMCTQLQLELNDRVQVVYGSVTPTMTNVINEATFSGVWVGE